jgi:hypothetical protein
VSANAGFIAEHVTLSLSLSVLRTGIRGNRVFALDVRFSFTWHSHYNRRRVAGLQGAVLRRLQRIDSNELELAVKGGSQGTPSEALILRE